MGPGAQVGKIPLAVKADVLPLACMLVNELQLVVLPSHFFLGLVGGQLETLQRDILLDDFFNLCLDLGQVFRREGLFHVEVVIEPIINGGADGKLCAGVQPANRLRHDVGAGVPIGFLALFRVKGEDLQRTILSNRGTQVTDLAVHPGAAGRLIEPHADRPGNLRSSDALFKLLDLAFQVDLYHNDCSFPKTAHFPA